MARRVPLKVLGIDPKPIVADMNAGRISSAAAVEKLTGNAYVDYRAEFQRVLDRPDDPQRGFSGSKEIRETGALSDKIGDALGDAIVLEDSEYEMLKHKLNLPGIFGSSHKNVRQMLDDVDNAEKVDLNKTKAGAAAAKPKAA